MIRTVCIGLGYRGKYLLQLLRQIPSFSVVGVADPSVSEVDDLACYSCGPDDYVRMLEELKPELAVIASPWDCHVPQACECLRHGCNVALEIRGGAEEGEYEPLLALEKETGFRVFPLENMLFARPVMAVARMAADGVFGRIMYLRGAYRHDIRDVLLDCRGVIGGKPGEGSWRGPLYLRENADLYPTHSFAPLCMIAGIGRDDAMVELTSVSSGAAGLASGIESRGGVAPAVVTGDIVSTQIRTARGVLVSLVHDTTLPRPRGFDLQVQGTRGIWDGERRSIYIEGASFAAAGSAAPVMPGPAAPVLPGSDAPVMPGSDAPVMPGPDALRHARPDRASLPAHAESWEPDAPWIDRYDHPFWRHWGAAALEADRHHAGIDYIMLRALASALQDTPVSVMPHPDRASLPAYPATLRDLALWTSVTPLSRRSIALRRTISLSAPNSL